MNIARVVAVLLQVNYQKKTNGKNWGKVSLAQLLVDTLEVNMEMIIMQETLLRMLLEALMRCCQLDKKDKFLSLIALDVVILGEVMD